MKKGTRQFSARQVMIKNDFELFHNYNSLPIQIDYHSHEMCIRDRGVYGFDRGKLLSLLYQSKKVTFRNIFHLCVGSFPKIFSLSSIYKILMITRGKIDCFLLLFWKRTFSCSKFLRE